MPGQRSLRSVTRPGATLCIAVTGGTTFRYGRRSAETGTDAAGLALYQMIKKVCGSVWIPCGYTDRMIPDKKKNKAVERFFIS